MRQGEYFIAMEWVRRQGTRAVSSSAAGKPGVAPGRSPRVHRRRRWRGRSARRVSLHSGVKSSHATLAVEHPFVPYAGEVKLCDSASPSFLRHSRGGRREGVIKGKVKLHEPEQAMGRHADSGSDIFSRSASPGALLDVTRSRRFQRHDYLLLKVRDCKYNPVRETRAVGAGRDVAPSSHARWPGKRDARYQTGAELACGARWSCVDAGARREGS